MSPASPPSCCSWSPRSLRRLRSSAWVGQGRPVVSCSLRHERWEPAGRVDAVGMATAHDVHALVVDAPSGEIRMAPPVFLHPDRDPCPPRPTVVVRQLRMGRVRDLRRPALRRSHRDRLRRLRRPVGVRCPRPSAGRHHAALSLPRRGRRLVGRHPGLGRPRAGTTRSMELHQLPQQYRARSARHGRDG